MLDVALDENIFTLRNFHFLLIFLSPETEILTSTKFSLADIFPLNIIREKLKGGKIMRKNFT